MAWKSGAEDDVSPDLLGIFRGDGVTADITEVGHSWNADVWFGDVHFGYRSGGDLYVKRFEIEKSYLEVKMLRIRRS